MTKKKGTPMTVSTESQLYKMPPRCKDGKHKWDFTHVRFTHYDEDLTTTPEIDTYFCEACKVCREVKQ